MTLEEFLQKEMQICSLFFKLSAMAAVNCFHLKDDSTTQPGPITSCTLQYVSNALQTRICSTKLAKFEVL